MNVVPLKQDALPLFFAYCKAYGRAHDESYLYDENLTEEAYQPGPDEPAYLLLDEHGNMAGAVSLMLSTGFREKKKGRFRILHVKDGAVEGYRKLLQAVLPHCAGLAWIYLYIPEGQEESRQALEETGFTIERYSYVLRRNPRPAGEIRLPYGFHLRPFVVEQDVLDYCRVRNQAFEVLLGNIPISPEDVRKEVEGPGYYPEGMLVLEHQGQTVGVVQAFEDTDEENLPVNFIYNLAVMPGFQGQGLGRMLLRAGIAAGQQHGLETCYLSVNAENERGVALYLSEGFEKAWTAVCYQLSVPLYS